MSVSANPSVSALETYNPAIHRSYDTVISLPYTLQDIKISPNEYLFSENINYSIRRLGEIFDFLQSQTTMYDSAIPTYADFWQGDSLGRTEIKSIASNNIDEIWYIDGNVVVGADLINMSTITTLEFSDVGEFEDPRSVAINTQGELFVLDSFLIHHYDISTPTDPVYLAYYGGLGGAKVPDKFQNPRMIHIDASDRIWVSDFGNKVVKVFNKNFGHLRTIEKQVYSITTDDTHVYLLGVDEKVYSYRIADWVEANSFDTFFGARRLEHDNVQKGFLYIQSTTKTEKWTIGGFKIGTFSKPSVPIGNLSGMVKPTVDNHIYVSDQSNIYKYLDYQRTLSILDPSVSAVTPLDEIIVDGDEIASPIVYNDVFAKLESNINILSQSVSGRFVNTLDADDTLLETSVVSISPSANWCSVPRIPINYIPSVNTFNTGFEQIYRCSQNFVDVVLNGQADREENNIDNNTFCWSLEALRCTGPQYKNTVRNPITFTELQYTPSLSCAPLTSSCCENNFPWFSLEATHVSGRQFNFAMNRVSGSELFEDDEINYVIWNEDVCQYTNDREFDVNFSEDGFYRIHHIAQDPGYLVHKGCVTVSILGGTSAVSGYCTEF
jgi:hypothetical protein